MGRDEGGLRGQLHAAGPWRAFSDAGGTVSIWRVDDPRVMATVVGRAVVTHGTPRPDCGRGRQDPAHTTAIRIAESDAEVWPTVRRSLAGVRARRRHVGCPVVPASSPPATLWAAAATSGEEPAPAAVSSLRPQVAAALAHRPSGRSVALIGLGEPPQLPADSDPVASRRGTLERGYSGTIWESDGVTYVASGGRVSRDGVDGLVISQGAGSQGWTTLAKDDGQLQRVERPSALSEAEIDRDVPPPAELAAEIGALDDLATWLTTGTRTGLDTAEPLHLDAQSLDALLETRGLAVGALPRPTREPMATLAPNGTLTVRTWGSVAVGGTRVAVRVTTRLAPALGARIGDIAALATAPARRRLRAGDARITLVLAEAHPRGDREAALNRAARRVLLTRAPGAIT